MSIKFRKYNTATDFKLVGDFLYEHYQPDNKDCNFLQPAWEYMHSHPLLDETQLDKIGIWEDDGKMVAVVHYESTLGESFYNVHPDYIHLKPEMLAYAEKYLYGKTPEGKTYLKAFISDTDKKFVKLVKSRGYKMETDHRLHRPLTKLDLTQPLPTNSLPDGFTLKSLVGENDPAKIELALWRGFDGTGKPPWDLIEGSKKKQSVPSFRKDLNIVVVAPDGNYVAYAGTWFEPVNKYAYVEPVCTDPDYRRRGFASTAIFEGVRRCKELGATFAYVGSTQPLYLSMGFKLLLTYNCWIKYFD